MDTQFWGPPGHKLLHSIAYCYSFGDNSDSQDTLNKNIVKIANKDLCKQHEPHVILHLQLLLRDMGPNYAFAL